MNPELVQLALHKQRLQLRSADQRAALVHHAQVFTPAFRGVDRVIDGVRWARDHAPLLTGVSLFVLVARPRAALRWARRGWLGFQLVRRVRNLLP
ncbi:YqjK-like family protein [Zoogloea sp.]|uniref:YqjK-like family protein n=1 Tax=Zoogloea sp. TaxID=49181 RepID=UPI0035B011B7